MERYLNYSFKELVKEVVKIIDEERLTPQSMSISFNWK